MQVNLLSHTSNPKEIIYSAARQCYSKNSAYDIYTKTEKISSEKLKGFILKLIKRGHLSPLEHVSFTFAIEGISRVCSHQLVRHRMASYSQQSQRYVSMDDFIFIIPPVISKNKKAKDKFIETINYLKQAYNGLKVILEKDAKSDREKLNEDLRFLLPQAAETKIVVTMNTRELIHFFSERLCLRAQWEIRELAARMLSHCKKILPEAFANIGAKCKTHRYCPEDDEACPLFNLINIKSSEERVASSEKET